MDDQDQAQQALVNMFRRDQVAEVQSTRKKRDRFTPKKLAWIVGITAVVFVLAPSAFLVIYPRFGPVDTMTAFCRAESGGDYTVAYTMLSQRARAHTSLAAFSQASDSANLVACTPNNGIPFIFGVSQASLDVAFETSGTSDSAANGGGASVGGTMSFVRENGQWRVDAMSPDLLHLSS